MKQTINLYAAIPKPPKVKLPATQIVTIVGIFILMLILAYGYGRWQIHTQKLALAASRTKENEARKQLDEITKGFPKVEEEMQLKQEMDRIKQQLADRQQLLNFIAQRHDVLRRGFATFFLAFAELTPEGVWLTHITIDNDDDWITLEGESVNSTLVSEFLARLQQSPIFSSKPFKYVDVKFDDKTKTVKFWVSTHEQQKPVETTPA